jgi:hypothetical protein
VRGALPIFLLLGVAACGGRGHPRHATLANVVDAGPPFVAPDPSMLRCYLESEDQPRRCHNRGCDVGAPLVCGEYVTAEQLETRRQLEATKSVRCVCVCDEDRRRCAEAP